MQEKGQGRRERGRKTRGRVGERGKRRGRERRGAKKERQVIHNGDSFSVGLPYFTKQNYFSICKFLHKQSTVFILVHQEH